MSEAPPRYPYVEIDVAPERSDDLSYELFDTGATGVELRDDTTFIKGAGHGLVTLVASFPTAEAAEAAANPWAAEGLAVRVGAVVGDAWRDKYKEHFAPFDLVDGVVVAPPWVDDPPQGTKATLVLDPGRAFGTGLHATTQLVAAQLVARASILAGVRVLDLGTGSGILAILAIALGAKSALGIDVDDVSVAVARENASLNSMTDRLAVEIGSVDATDDRFPVVLANIRATILEPMAADLVSRVADGGTLVLSGILRSQHDACLNTFVDQGLRHVETTERPGDDDAWVAIVLERGEA